MTLSATVNLPVSEADLLIPISESNYVMVNINWDYSANVTFFHCGKHVQEID